MFWLLDLIAIAPRAEDSRVALHRLSNPLALAEKPRNVHPKHPRIALEEMSYGNRLLRGEHEKRRASGGILNHAETIAHFVRAASRLVQIPRGFLRLTDEFAAGEPVEGFEPSA